MKKYLFIVLLVGFWGCLVDNNGDDDWKGVGVLQLGFETSSFTPQDGNDNWWVKFESDSAFEAYQIAAGEPENSIKSTNRYYFSNPITCRVKGKLSKKGEYGHMGGYSRKIYIKKILEVISL